MKALGMTLVESMTSLMIASILTMVAIPSLVQFIDNQRVISISDTLNQHLEYARSEAIKRNQNVQLCAGAIVNNQCSTQNASWNQGWLITTTDNSGIMHVLKRQSAFNTTSLIDIATVALTFTSNGLLSSGSTSVMISSANCSGNGGRLLSISHVGLVNTQKVSC